MACSRYLWESFKESEWRPKNFRGDEGDRVDCEREIDGDEVDEVDVEVFECSELVLEFRLYEHREVESCLDSWPWWCECVFPIATNTIPLLM